MTGHNKIIIAGNVQVKEVLSAEAISAGHLLALASTGKVGLASTGVNQKLIALENQADATGVDGAYISGTTVRCGIMQRGANAVMKLATSQTIVIGDYLVSAGSGNLKKASTETGAEIIGIALEAITTTSTVANILVEVL